GAVEGGGRTVIPVDSFYDRDWNLLPHRRIRTVGISEARPVARPDRLPDMIAAAEALCSGIDYLRIDMFLIRNEIWFGEITVYPGSAFNKYEVAAESGQVKAENLDVLWGRLWRLPEIPLAK